MFNILIAEDENIIRKGLKTIIRKMNFPIDNIYEASNGEQAYNITIKKKPEIIITDIVMPKLDGLDFIKKLEGHNISSKFIIVSGHSDFDFAKKAIKFGITDYLLKPVQKHELHKTLSSVINSLKDAKMVNEVNQEIISNYIDTINKYKRSWIHNILIDQYKFSNYLNNVNELNLNLNGSGYRNIAIYYECKQSTKCVTQINENCIKLLDEIKRDYQVLYYYMLDWNYISAIILLKNEDNEKLNNFIYKVESYIKKSNSPIINIFMGLSNWSESSKDLPVLIQQSEELLLTKYYDRNKHVFTYSSNNHSTHSYVHYTQYEKIANAIIFNESAIIPTNIDDLIKIISDNKNPSSLINIIRNLSLYVVNSCKKSNYTLALENEIRNCLLSSSSFENLSNNLKNIFIEKCRDMSVQNKSSKNTTVRFILKYIEENYTENIDLDTISTLVFMNSNYISSLFKSKMGMGFVKYLQNYRIEKSKLLLLNTTKKIYQIANAVGFSNDKYFSKVFKNITGSTPLEYRKKAI